jgi:hypothetical protein
MRKRSLLASFLIILLVTVVAMFTLNVSWASHDDPPGCKNPVPGSPGFKNPNCDSDDDGINNQDDNCPLVFNPDQTDTDGDGEGDACDADDDNDGVPDGSDNCPLIANPGQEDNDGDDIGNVCDPTPDPVDDDRDDDGILNDDDNCPDTPNADQKDTDGDGQGDACDNDDDNDGVNDGDDNCPLVANPGQEDGDGDDIGTACDPDEGGGTQTTCETDNGNDGSEHSSFDPDSDEVGPISSIVHEVDQALPSPLGADGGVVSEVNCAIIVTVEEALGLQ